MLGVYVIDHSDPRKIADVFAQTAKSSVLVIDLPPGAAKPTLIE